MRVAAMIATGWLALAPSVATAQSHTIVALSHSDHTAYELDPATGKILNKFTAVDQPHEGLASRHKVGVNPFGGGLRSTAVRR